MKISDEAKYYRDTFSQMVGKDGGIVAIVPNLKMLWNQAAMANDRLRIFFAYGGQKPRGPFSRAAATHRVDRTWHCAILRGLGYNATRGDSLTETLGDVPAFYDQTELYRDGIRAITDTSVEQPLDYRGDTPFDVASRDGSLIMVGYVIEFSTAHDLPVMQPLNPNQPIVII